jgi:hypothetical protein
MSSGLWLPNVIDLPGLASTSAVNSWFSIQHLLNPAKPNSPPIYSSAYITSLADCTSGQVIRSKRIRIYPTTAQKRLFRQWLGTSRHVYNETIKHLGLPKEERAGHWMGAAKIILPSLPEWARLIPYQIKKIAIEDAYQAFSNGIRKWKQSGQPIIPTENQGRMVALDPGIRTFVTGFAEDQAFKIGQGDFARIARLCYHLDRLLSTIAKAKCRHKAQLRKATQRLRWKIKDLVDELHCKVIRFLLDRFDLILLPTFETQAMSVKSKRKIRAKSVRTMLGYAFFRFGQRLESAAQQVGKVIACNNLYLWKRN